MRFRHLLILLLILLGLASQAARFLRVNDPQNSDAIVVLAGETTLRPIRAIALLRQRMGQYLFIDVVAQDRVFGQPLSDLAQKYASTLPDANRISVCPITGLSTNSESSDAGRCLQSVGAHKVLIVTSDFHTRRALTIFRHRLPQFQFSVAGAGDSTQFGVAWWTNRELAKVTLDEWMKLIWWEVIDRWRKQ